MYTFTNCLIFFYLMYRVLVKMEPTVALDSFEYKRFWVRWVSGNRHFSVNWLCLRNWSNSSIYMKRCVFYQYRLSKTQKKTESKSNFSSYNQGVRDFEHYELESSKQKIITSLDTIGKFFFSQVSFYSLRFPQVFPNFLRFSHVSSSFLMFPKVSSSFLIFP